MRKLMTFVGEGFVMVFARPIWVDGKIELVLAFKDKQENQGRWAKRFSLRRREARHYERRRPEETVLYQLVQEHLETLLAQVEAETGAAPSTGIDTVVAYFEGPDGEKLELIAPTGPFVRKERLARK